MENCEMDYRSHSNDTSFKLQQNGAQVWYNPTIYALHTYSREGWSSIECDREKTEIYTWKIGIKKEL